MELGRKGGEHFLFPKEEMEAKTQNDGSQLLVVYWRAGGIHVVKDNGSGWGDMLTKQGGVTHIPPKSQRQ
jgi:hypothetical protein